MSRLSARRLQQAPVRADGAWATAAGLQPWPSLRTRVALVGGSRRPEVCAFARALGEALARAGFELSAPGTCASVGLAAAAGFHRLCPEPERLRLVMPLRSGGARGPALGTVVHAGAGAAEVRARLLEGVGALVLVGGSAGCRAELREARARGLPVLAVPGTGGLADAWPEVAEPLRPLPLASAGAALQVVGALHVQLARALARGGTPPEAAAPAAQRPLRLFYSYAHEDRKARAVLNKHLHILEREGMLTGWHDGDIGAGREWDRTIREQLARADVVLLLVSVHFIASSYCAEVEVAQAMARHAAGEARVIPVILGAVDWSRQPYARLQALPAGGRPVREWSSRERAWADVARGIRRALDELRAAPSREKR
ncbi:toll/interleukin-1 receptor domain-containing protein [Aggregicoccus sp. 17bor-14]|uniref:toll/interleukin-1 receptor domain-containing protein n=1 Tax=Myxococcaceae TaxID=31 RepID=UPI00129C17BF|nr:MULTISPECIES: toll/interleukin-1 receptor domain-containing protein [Myxococcaceae]MBF5045881.1 TIR domain-containing protein [Simulacricoccus sp. 17bor-14]MRI91615.1 toll/interleukin-1 receptor domain-containing protein [Aggregicoccus sp. 17bor-14]